MHFTVLRSGSSGNCSLIEHGATRVLIDAGGQTQKGLAALLGQSMVDPATLAAVVVTHLHGDHINVATLRLAQRYGIALWMHEKNHEWLPELFAGQYRAQVEARVFGNAAFTIGPLCVTPFALAHDARGTTSGFRICPSASPGHALVYAADLGHAPDSVIAQMADAHTLFVECNHDAELLWANPQRPYQHKKRVTGRHGHLSNEQCAEALVAAISRSMRPPQWIILGHLSGDHNTPHRALETVGAALARAGLRPRLCVAPRDSATPRFDIL